MSGTISPVLIGASVTKLGDSKPVADPLPVGKVVRLSAVYGDLVHPYVTLDGGKPLVFETSHDLKVKVDDWINTQYVAGKLKLSD